MHIELGNTTARLIFGSSISAWLQAASTPAALAAQLLQDADTYDGDLDNSALELPLSALAAWPESVARAAGLPPNSPLPIDLRTTQGLGKAGTRITTRWLRPGTALPVSSPPVINGLLLMLNGKSFRLQEPYFTALHLVDEFNALSDEEAMTQLRVWAQLRQQLGETEVGKVSDFNLRALRVITADAFSLNFTTDVRGDVQLQPVLMADGAGENPDPSETTPRALLEQDETLFVSRLDDMPTGSAAFPLANGSYVVVDARLQNALAAIKTLRQAPPEVRKRAALNPYAYLAQVLGDDVMLGKPLFVETERYSKRVSDVAEWEPPIVPWIKITAQAWEPAAAGFRISGKNIPLGNSAQIAQAIAQTQQAMANGKPSVILQDPAQPKTQVEVPATTATLTTLQKLHKAVQHRENPEPPDNKPGEDKPTTQVLVIETNFEGTGFISTHVDPRAGVAKLPDCLRSEPKPHQREGIAWLQQHWLSGSKGALLADDMGLGKTYQSLAFMGWLREIMDQGLYPRKPIMIVAPVGLLKNWEEEHGMHLMAPGVGSVVRAYGSELQRLKRGTHDNGSVKLDTLLLSKADWILANYETINTYQLSFGLIEFAVVIYDEAQKIKSPDVRVTQAAKALNTEFTLAMTGTPVENRLADLWCIADTVQPGALGDLKEFSQNFEADDSEENLLRLRQQIWHETNTAADNNRPRLMLRRMKSDRLKGLPEKRETYLRIPMPQRQGDAYERAVTIKETKGGKATLEMIQALRAISLHPATYEGGFSSERDLVPDESARFIGMMQVLKEVHAKQEKALIFVESLELQSDQHLPLFLQREFDMPRPPLVINGEVDTTTRQRRVHEFQNAPGFDVMLLSPKAGGVGITLTAANHVIHLSRWWNPAVEDQCSDRAYRIGQQRDVTIYYPMAVHPEAPDQSFDVKLHELMTRKRELSQRLLAPGAITKAEIGTLLDELNVF